MTLFGPQKHFWITASVLMAAAGALSGCTEPVSWPKLLTAKITQQYPAYTVQAAPGGNLKVDRPGMAAVTVDVNDIAAFCLRGPKDCDYATDQMLLALGK